MSATIFDCSTKLRPRKTCKRRLTGFVSAPRLVKTSTSTPSSWLSPIGPTRKTSISVKQPAAGMIVAEDKRRSEEHTSELQSLMRISYAVFCLKKKKNIKNKQTHRT